MCRDPSVEAFDFVEWVSEVEKHDVRGMLGEEDLCLLYRGGRLGGDHALRKLGL